jgi:hypothetical protein
MLKTADATAPAETHADSINKGAIEKNRKAVQPAHARAQKVIDLLFQSFRRGNRHKTSIPQTPKK